MGERNGTNNLSSVDHNPNKDFTLAGQQDLIAAFILFQAPGFGSPRPETLGVGLVVLLGITCVALSYI
jgi:hypothetical protein